jgi:plastocyanin
MALLSGGGAPGRRAALLGSLLLWGGAPGAGQAATLRGRVDVRMEWPSVQPRPAVTDLGMPAPRQSPDRRRSVVYLEAGPLGAFEEAPRADGVLNQRNEAFFPYVLAVQAGATVHFPNDDRTYHNVFSFSKARRFDLGRYPRGQSKSVRFDRPGVVRVFCDIHSHMSAFILVFAHPFFASTDAEGRFRIPDVPAGSYTLAVWTDGAVRETRKLEVPAGDAVLDLEFVVR